MTHYHVYGVGNALVDMEFEVEDAVLDSLLVDKGLMTLIDETRHHSLLAALDERTGRQASGGSAANTVIAAAQLGASTFYSCKVADDDTGAFYMRDLDTCGVKNNLNGSPRASGVTGKCIVLITPDAERSMNTYLGITRELSVAELDDSAIRHSEYVYIEGYLVPEPNARQAAVRAREIAQEAGVKTALTLSDANMVRHFKESLLSIAEPGLDMVFCNEEEARLMFGTEDLGECIQGFRSLAARFAITRGAEGALLFDGQTIINIPAVNVNAVDTNGAGDMYAGAFLYGLTHDMPFTLCGELAAAAAAELITRFGPRLTREDMQAIRRQFAI